jgi:hypothetical protein
LNPQSSIRILEHPGRKVGKLVWLSGVRLPGGANRLTVRFSQPEADAAHSVVVQGNGFTLDRVTAKRKDGYEVEFSKPAPQEAALDWQLVR